MQTLEEKRQVFTKYVDRDLANIAALEKKIESLDTGKEKYQKLLESHLSSLKTHQSFLKYMRENNAEDIKHRQSLYQNYASLIDETIPDNVPMVFHGTKNIGVVEEILKSGGLLTPEERGADFTSFATQIDVTAKTNIRTSLEFASFPETFYMPYGAIFAFFPRPDEYEKVLKTQDSTEVESGVGSINFIKEPERLVGIITTSENIDLFRTWCQKYGINPEKVFTHEMFLTMCAKRDFTPFLEKGNVK